MKTARKRQIEDMAKKAVSLEMHNGVSTTNARGRIETIIEDRRSVLHTGAEREVFCRVLADELRGEMPEEIRRYLVLDTDEETICEIARDRYEMVSKETCTDLLTEQALELTDPDELIKATADGNSEDSAQIHMRAAVEYLGKFAQRSPWARRLILDALRDWGLV